MAVTLTSPELRAALRLGDTHDEALQAARLRTVAAELVVRHAPDAPDIIHDEAVVRLAGYWFDQPTAPRDTRYANALRNSGAAAILLPYRVHRAGAD